MEHQYSIENLDQHLLDNLSSAVLLFDNELKLKYINTAGEMLFAASSRQIIGLGAHELIQYPGSMLVDNLHRALESEQPFTEREHQLTLYDGKQITIDCTVTPILEEGITKELLVEILQVDHQVRISREERLLSRNQASRALVRNLAHEIKNPLGGLRGAAQLLERELPNAELKEYTQIIIQEADRMRKLVDNMLGPNKLPQKKEVAIHQVLERVCKLVLAETGMTLKINKDYDPSIPNLFGDMDQLIQAFLNIFRNGARAAGNEGKLGIRTRILRQFSIGSHHHRHVISVEISDNGPGIPEELQERIFFPMVSGQNSGEGMGIGLSISQSLINRHQGLIEFSSEQGSTVFSVLLPLEQRNG